MSTVDEAQLELEGLRKRFDDVVAVDDIDLTVREGEFFSLLGPSGCGKTTTLRLISGFERPTEGRVLLDGVDATGFPPNKRDTNLVFQHLSLFPHRSVKGNIEYGLKKSGVAAEERERRVKEFLKLVDLEGFEDRDPTELSGGQQQRVALARALVNEPSLLLFDEPLASLDRKLRQQMQVELRELHNEVEGAFFYVTHDQKTAMTLSDRMAIMRDGQIEQVGTPEEIYSNPTNEFIANFVGDTNLFDGQVHRENGQQVVEVGGSDGFRYTPAEDLEDGPVRVSIRPEHLYIGDASNGSLSGDVTARYFQGDQILYEVDPDIPDVSNVTVQSGDEKQVREGETVGIDVVAGEPVVFEG